MIWLSTDSSDVWESDSSDSSDVWDSTDSSEFCDSESDSFFFLQGTIGLYKPSSSSWYKRNIFFSSSSGVSLNRSIVSLVWISNGVSPESFISSTSSGEYITFDSSILNPCFFRESFLCLRLG